MISSTDRRPLIAVICNRHGQFQQPIVNQLFNILEQAGYGLICVAGRELGLHPSASASDASACNAIYTVAAKYNVEAYIVLSWSIGYNAPEQRVIDLVKQFAHKPVVSLGVNVPGISSIVIDNARGMRKLMEHMTSDPDRKRFVFIRGFPNTSDSAQREKVFREVLHSKGLIVDEELVIDGFFMTADAFDALDRLLLRTRNIDGVVAASDAMAVSAIHALTQHGLRVPEDVIVSGVDGAAVAMKSSPPVTTFDCSHEYLIKACANCILDQLGGNRVEKSARQLKIDVGRLIVRASSKTSSLIRSITEPLERKSLSIEGLRNTLSKSLSQTALPSGFSVTELVEDVIELLLHGSDQSGARVLSALNLSHKKPENVHWWRFFQLQLDKVIRAFDIDDLQIQAMLRMIALQTHIHETIWAVNTREQFERFKHQQLSDQLHLHLTTCTDFDGVWIALEKAFTKCGVQRAYIALYNSPGPEPDNRAWLAMAYAHRKRFSPSAGSFDCCSILPEELQCELNTGMLVVHPLCSSYCQVGFLVLDPRNLLHVNVENLAHSIANSLSNCLQLRNLARQTADLQSANNELIQIANYDPLTGLPNRNLFYERLECAFHDANKLHREVALLFFDLDGFKHVNDSLGHSAGDQLLIIVARRLQMILRQDDNIARLGGDEFALILEVVEGEDRLEWAARNILSILSKPYQLLGRSFNLSVSIGVALYPKDGKNSETLLKHADMAMYKAKSMGKNCICNYTEELNKAANFRIQLDQAMRLGFLQKEFCMHYQPRVSLETNQLRGFEALMRWSSKDQRLPASAKMPGVFIAVAEQSGFIRELDTFALESACRQLKLWERQGNPATIAVNLSVRQLQQDDIVTTILSIIEHQGLNPNMLELEITESTAMTDVESNIGKLFALRGAGIRISIDDFGTGYSSLNYLKRLPVTSLKIDKSFLTDITSADGGSSPDAAIVRAVVAMGKSLGYSLIAEGIETEEQRAFLTSLNCDEAQGYLFSRALSANDATRYLRQQYEDQLVG